LAASGFAGCGAFSAPAPLTGISVRFQSLIPSAPSEPCTPEARSVEQNFVATLSATRRLTIRGGYLVLIDEGGKDRAYFAPG
jgi:heat shock protein HslJ